MKSGSSDGAAGCALAVFVAAVLETARFAGAFLAAGFFANV